MSRLAFCLTTLLAAIPAGLLIYLTVTTFLFHIDKLPPVLMGVLGLTLLAAVAVVLSPAMVLLGGRSRKTAALAGGAIAGGAAGGGVAALESEEIVAEGFDEEQVEEFVAGEGVSEEILSPVEEDESSFDMETAESADDLFSFDDVEEFDDEKPSR